MPNVKRYMTREPYRVCSKDSVRHARNLMSTHLIRHLPVLDGDQLVGVVSQHDLDVVAAVSDADLERIEVARVMTAPIQVWGETPIDEVSTLMKDQRRDCVVVKGGHGVEGIFTATDALEALADLVRRATA